MQYADTLLIVVHEVEIQTPTNVCISTILLQLTRWLAWGGFRWLVRVKKEENPSSSSNPFLPVVVVTVVVVLVVLGGRSIV